MSNGWVRTFWGLESRRPALSSTLSTWTASCSGRPSTSSFPLAHLFPFYLLYFRISHSCVHRKDIGDGGSNCLWGILVLSSLCSWNIIDEEITQVDIKVPPLVVVIWSQIFLAYQVCIFNRYLLYLSFTVYPLYLI